MEKGIVLESLFSIDMGGCGKNWSLEGFVLCVYYGQRIQGWHYTCNRCGVGWTNKRDF